MKLTPKEIMMLYHTTLRNVGLYTSISLALLGYSRFYRGKGLALYNISFIIISMIWLYFAIILLNNMNTDHEILLSNLDESHRQMLYKWYFVPNNLIILLLTVKAFSFFTLIREIQKVL